MKNKHRLQFSSALETSVRSKPLTLAWTALNKKRLKIDMSNCSNAKLVSFVRHSSLSWGIKHRQNLPDAGETIQGFFASYDGKYMSPKTYTNVCRRFNETERSTHWIFRGSNEILLKLLVKLDLLNLRRPQKVCRARNLCAENQINPLFWRAIY